MEKLFNLEALLEPSEIMQITCPHCGNKTNVSIIHKLQYIRVCEYCRRGTNKETDELLQELDKVRDLPNCNTLMLDIVKDKWTEELLKELFFDNL